MTDQTAQEPTMEEILASIRRIISEDDAPAETAAPQPANEPEPMFEPEPVQASPAMFDETPSVQEDDVLELTDRWQAPVAESIGDLDVSTLEPEPAPRASHEPDPFPVSTRHDEIPMDSAPIVSAATAAGAASAFAGLSSAFAKPAAVDDAPSAGGGGAIEDMVRAMIRPMLRDQLRDWLDANLQKIVEDEVSKEVERVSRLNGLPR